MIITDAIRSILAKLPEIVQDEYKAMVDMADNLDPAGVVEIRGME